METRKIRLEADRIAERSEMAAYMKELFGFSKSYRGSLDGLYDYLSEVCEYTDICVDNHTMFLICQQDFAWDVLKVISDAALENPYLRVVIL